MGLVLVAALGGQSQWTTWPGQGYLAPAVVDLAKKHKAEVDVALADMTVALEPAWKGKVSPLEKRLREAIKEAQSSCDRVDGQISDAQNMIAPKT